MIIVSKMKPTHGHIVFSPPFKTLFLFSDTSNEGLKTSRRKWKSGKILIRKQKREKL